MDKESRWELADFICGTEKKLGKMSDGKGQLRGSSIADFFFVQAMGIYDLSPRVTCLGRSHCSRIVTPLPTCRSPDAVFRIVHVGTGEVTSSCLSRRDRENAESMTHPRLHCGKAGTSAGRSAGEVMSSRFRMPWRLHFRPASSRLLLA